MGERHKIPDQFSHGSERRRGYSHTYGPAEGISGDRITTLYGILNGTSNFILTEIEKRRADFDEVLAEAQQLGYAEADPTADIDGYDARSKLSILAALAFGEKITPSDIYTDGIRRIQPIDFQYAHRLGHTIRLICAAKQTPEGLILYVRPALIPSAAISQTYADHITPYWFRGSSAATRFTTDAERGRILRVLLS
jgi:homoserine dehydrogenase